ncbi:MAG: chemotaxis protein CheX, partial [Pseudomonadota bacterium]
MDVNLINPFVEATLNILETMAQTKAEAGKPYVKEDSVARGDVSAIIGMVGEISGMVSVSFSAKCIISVASRMLGEKITQKDDIRDAVGEITNMVSGRARCLLEQQGRTLAGTLPTVIMGKNHTLVHMSDSPVLAIPFTTDSGDFTIELSFGQYQHREHAQK